MISIFYVAFVLQELASRCPEFRSACSKVEMLGREWVHCGLIPRKSIPARTFHGDQSTDWLIKEVDGTLHSLELGAVHKPDQFSEVQTVIRAFNEACRRYA